ncbi:hypothetical protein BC831DRAFT_390157, partial [Entophlyctis helioformis]
HTTTRTTRTTRHARLDRAAVFNVIFFSALVITVPLIVFYLCLNLWFNGNPTYAGILAALSANVVAIVFVIVAFAEED